MFFLSFDQLILILQCHITHWFKNASMHEFVYLVELFTAIKDKWCLAQACTVWVGDHVSLRPSTCGIYEIIIHIINEHSDLISVLLQSLELTEQVFNVLFTFFKTLGLVDAVASGPDIVGMCLGCVHKDDFVAKFSIIWQIQFQDGM